MTTPGQNDKTIDLEPADLEALASMPPAESEMQIINRKLAGRYELLEIIGTGGVGAVYRAFDITLQRMVAIKVIRSKFRVSDRIMERFREEAMIVASLAHPHIVHIHEIIECELTPLIVMEYVQGRNLEQLIRERRLDRRRLLDILISVCETIAHAHAHGVIHCDIKPENILISEEGLVKIADFGIALRVNPEEEHGAEPKMVMGSPAFMSPEQARGDRAEITSGTDIFGIGATLYYALAGARILEGTGREILNQLKSATYAPPRFRDSSIPVDLQILCRKCLERNPEDRYRSAWLLADDLRRLQEGLPISARTYSWPEKMWRAVQYRKRNSLFALGLVLIALAFFLSLQMIQYRTTRHTINSLLKDKVKGLAATAALLIDPGEVDALRTPADREKPAFSNLVATLEAIKSRNEHIAFVYVARRAEKPGFVSFVALDSMTNAPASSTAAPELDIGSLFSESPNYPDLFEGFERPSVDRKLNVLDEWGVGLSGYAPIRDQNGVAIALVGVDVKSDELTLVFRQIDRIYLLSLNLSLLLAAVMVVLILRWRVAYWDRRAAAIPHENPLRPPPSFAP